MVALARMDEVRKNLKRERFKLKREKNPQERIALTLKVRSLRKQLRQELESLGAVF